MERNSVRCEAKWNSHWRARHRAKGGGGLMEIFSTWKVLIGHSRTFTATTSAHNITKDSAAEKKTTKPKSTSCAVAKWREHSIISPANGFAIYAQCTHSHAARIINSSGTFFSLHSWNLWLWSRAGRKWWTCTIPWAVCLSFSYLIFAPYFFSIRTWTAFSRSLSRFHSLFAA